MNVAHKTRLMIESMLPQLSPEEKTFFDSLPDNYLLDVPYIQQEKMHWSGAAIVQMISAYHEREYPEQLKIVAEAGWDDYSKYNHETLQEGLIRYMAGYNYMPGIYYPAAHVNKHIQGGVEGTDLIKGYGPVFDEIDWKIFKALLVSFEAPLLIRLHFTQREYNMPEDMAQALDTGGHAVLLVGYNEKGFIVHDPWNKDWGGRFGGPNQLLTYKWVADNPVVNCSKSCIISFSPLAVSFEAMRDCIVQNREITVSLRVELPGIKSVLQDIYVLSNVRSSLEIDGDVELVNAIEANQKPYLCPGEQMRFKWKVRTGDTVASFPVSATVSADLHIPAYPWEKDSEPENYVISGSAPVRINVTDRDWVNKFGRYDTAEERLGLPLSEESEQHVLQLKHKIAGLV